MPQDWTYLSTIKDLYDDFIVVLIVDHTNSIALVTHVLKLAKQKDKATYGLILHSDQGMQDTLQAYHVLISD